MSLIEEARTVRQRVIDRLAELEPLVREYEELRKLAGEMGIEAEPGKRAAAPAAAPASPSPASAAAPEPPEAPPTPAEETPSAAQSSPTAAAPGAPTRRTRRRKAEKPAVDDTEVAEAVLQAIAADPGKSVVDYAERLNLAPTALYKPVRELTADGKVVKRARQLYPA